MSKKQQKIERWFFNSLSLIVLSFLIAGYIDYKRDKEIETLKIEKLKLEIKIKKLQLNE
ncbi:hypothetical protein [Maribacter sp.]|uniref:hypothetical protein n=1 Tax=Maribacter sp. TaxID=1897614 RepID=UPI0025BA785D|nr:hypothetical protein [Maribacter sp.]